LFLVGQFLKIFFPETTLPNEPLNRGPSIDASHQVSVHLAKRLQRRFLEIDKPETRIAYGGHVG
jgi:hypothetical protein